MRRNPFSLHSSRAHLITTHLHCDTTRSRCSIYSTQPTRLGSPLGRSRMSPIQHCGDNWKRSRGAFPASQLNSEVRTTTDSWAHMPGYDVELRPQRTEISRIINYLRKWQSGNHC